MNITLKEGLSKSPNTFKECRVFLMELLKNKDLVLQLENGKEYVYIPYIVKFIESKGFEMIDVLVAYRFTVVNATYSELIKISLIGMFHRIEKGNIDLKPF